jgi:uncharacterized DUF497 family protein
VPLRFTWDQAKAAVNRAKHKISFEIAARVFLDPFALSEQDRIEGGEYRWRTIGSVEGVTILLVAHTVHDEEDGTEVIRIISARQAERSERRRYEEERYRQLRT